MKKRKYLTHSDVVSMTRRGNVWALALRLKHVDFKKRWWRKISESTPPRASDLDYFNGIWGLYLDEGGEFKNAIPGHFTHSALTGDVGTFKPIRFYTLVVGFEDTLAPSRSWGMNMAGLRRYYRDPNLTKLVLMLLKVLLRSKWLKFKESVKEKCETFIKRIS